MSNLRRLILDGAHNCRDLGGYPAIDCKMTKWGKVYRSDALTQLSERDWDTLKESNVQVVIDLRNFMEAEAAPVKVPEGVHYYNYSLMKEMEFVYCEDLDLPENQKRILDSMRPDYCRTLFGNLSCVAAILKLISRALENSAVIFMCSAGKDRTGIIAAILLYLCGVADEDIIADYMVSHNYNENGVNRRMKECLPEKVTKLLGEKLCELIKSEPENMKALLRGFKEQDILCQLDRIGFSYGEQELLQMQMVE